MEWLINWLWQGCAATLIVGCSLSACRSVNAATRYFVWWMTLLVVLLLAALPCLPCPAGSRRWRSSDGA